jgi:hypothetical protein
VQIRAAAVQVWVVRSRSEALDLVWAFQRLDRRLSVLGMNYVSTGNLELVLVFPATVTVDCLENAERTGTF